MVVIDRGKMSISSKHFTFELTGGALCLDFANTVDRRPDPLRREDHLTRGVDVLSWLSQAHNLSSKEGQQLAREIKQSPVKAASLLRRAVTLRETIYRIFSAIATGGQPAHSDLDTLNSVISRMMPRMRVVSQRGAFALRWILEGTGLDTLMWPIVKSAADLLTSDRLASVRECAAHDCGWLFMDHSPNQNRRWCDMKVCGNRAKARRHYQRRRTVAE
jgi:predicted RNA-binding Zn ribbon-like protein